MVMKKIIESKEVFICEICKADYSGREKDEDFERAKKCEESCKIIPGK